MKTTIRTIELTVETRERTVVGRPAKDSRAYCRVCHCESEIRPIQTIYENFGLELKCILGLVADKSVGFGKTQDGTFLICVNCIESLPLK